MDEYRPNLHDAVRVAGDPREWLVVGVLGDTVRLYRETNYGGPDAMSVPVGQIQTT